MKSTTEIQCPKCGSSSEIICHGKRHANYPSGCLMIAGLPFAMLHQLSCPIDYECKSCQTKFGIRNLMGKFAILIFLLFIIWFISIIVYVIIKASQLETL